MARKEFPVAVKKTVVKRATKASVVYCEKCGLPAKKWQIDHVIADSHGGKPVIENAELICEVCFGEKNPKDTTIAAQIKRQEAAHLRIATPTRNPIPAPAPPRTSAESVEDDQHETRRCRSRVALRPIWTEGRKPVNAHAPDRTWRAAYAESDGDHKRYVDDYGAQKVTDTVLESLREALDRVHIPAFDEGTDDLSGDEACVLNIGARASLFFELNDLRAVGVALTAAIAGVEKMAKERDALQFGMMLLAKTTANYAAEPIISEALARTAIADSRKESAQ